MARWIKFLIAIALGAAAGMYFGWVVSPVEYVDASPAALRVDYRADYVLMVAEVYDSEGDLSMAVRRLAQLGDLPPADIVAEAIAFGMEKNNFVEPDLALLQKLAIALQSWNPSLGVTAP